uniref:hypothetical protein n=1 Tax=Mariniflexile sp. TaxID=1979402 RepID=UPI0040475460
MKFIPLLFLSFISYSQCNTETYVQYYNSTDLAFSSSRKVSVTFGKGSEVSNSYNYISFEQESLYCVINGFEKVYNVKLFTSYGSVYETSCSAIISVFTDGYVKGKDQEGRIWKIFKPTTSNYQGQSYERPAKKYNPTTSSINTEEISRGLSSMQQKIDKNREAIFNKADLIKNRITLLNYKIERLNSPSSLVDLKDEIRNVGNNCLNDTDFGSNASSQATLSCLNKLISELDVLEMRINNYTPTDNSKVFTINKASKKSISYCSISSIRNVNGKTAIEFDYISPHVEEGWINIDPNTYLYDATHKKNFKLIGVLGTKFSPEKRSVPYNEKIKFILYFEQIPIDTKTISIIECERDSCFNFYGVKIL